MGRFAAVFAIALSLSCGDQVIVREVENQCGNGSIEGDEVCDDGNAINGDGCTNSCNLAACGDQVTRTDLSPGEDGFEECDDGNVDDADGCLNDCVAARCGDGIVV